MKCRYLLFVFMIILSFNAQSQTLKLIANPDTICEGFSGHWSKVYNNNFYSPYKNLTGKYQLAKFDGNNVSLINNPDSGTIDSLYPGTVFNNMLYFFYTNTKGLMQLASFDGTKIGLINNPDTLSSVYQNPAVADSSIIQYGNNLYFYYNDIYNAVRLAKYDGISISLIAKPNNNYAAGINGWANMIQYNNNLFFINSGYKYNYQLAKYDGNKITLVSPDSINLETITNLVLFQNKLMLSSMDGNSNIYQYDSSSFIMLKTPGNVKSISIGSNLVVANNNLYFTCINTSGNRIIAQYDGNNIITILNKDSSNGQSPMLISFNNKIYSSYSKSFNTSFIREFNGITNAYYNNPNVYGEINGFSIFNNNLYCSNWSGIFRLGMFTGNGYFMFANPDNGNAYYNQITLYNGFVPTFINSYQNKVYTGYLNISKKYQLSYADTSIILATKGRIETINGKPIKSVEVKYNGSTKGNSFSDSMGNYSINLSYGNYTITPNKNNDINKTNGVTAIDIALTQAHVLGKNLLNSPYKLIAADVNGDGKVTALDIVYMKRLILGLDTTFNNSVTNEKRLWAFVDSSYKFADTTNPFPFKDSISYIGLNANQVNQTFIGIKLGDVNWDWNPAMAKPPHPPKGGFNTTSLPFDAGIKQSYNFKVNKSLK